MNTIVFFIALSYAVFIVSAFSVAFVRELKHLKTRKKNIVFHHIDKKKDILIPPEIIRKNTRENQKWIH
jgi:mRNA-degrading endonuclease RelE of RelBE toxin-antitoxin system